MGQAEADCSTLIEKLYVFLDAEIGDEERAALQAHIERCVPCHGLVDFERDFKAFVRRRCGERAPKGLAERLRAKLNELL
ncbi:MAG TPA: mycothiol system anti-sigma-R factor [Actinomycetota bacterium]